MSISKKKLLIATCVVLCLGIICTALLYGIPRANENNAVTIGNSEVPLSGGVSFAFDSDAKDYIGNALEDKSPGVKGIKIPGYSSLAMAANTTDINVLLLNPEGNPCHFMFELILADTGETIYRSQLVEPSKCIEGITLTTPMLEGIYNLILKIHTYDIETLAPMNGADLSVELSVI